MFSLDFVHNFLGVSHLQPHHPRAPKQLKSRWICQNRAGSKEFHVEKTLKNFLQAERSMNSISVQKLSKSVEGARRTACTKYIGEEGGVPLSRLEICIVSFVQRLTWHCDCVFHMLLTPVSNIQTSNTKFQIHEDDWIRKGPEDF